MVKKVIIFLTTLLASACVFLGFGVVQSSAANCDKAYPDVCIPSPPPDLDCKDISHRNFKVLPADPHKFDKDKDGIGCEKR